MLQTAEAERSNWQECRQNVCKTPLYGSLCGSLCEEADMATNMDIAPELIDRAVAVSGERTKKAAVNAPSATPPLMESIRNPLHLGHPNNAALRPSRSAPSGYA